MRSLLIVLFFLNCYIDLFCQQQKIISDCTITFAVSNPDPNAKDEYQNALKTIYIKGRQIRIDIVSNTLNQSIFYNGNTGQSSVLKSLGESKYISSYSAAEWQNENAGYDRLKISFSNKVKKIMEYNCREATIQLENGNNYTVYYVPDILPSITENNFEFKIVPGLILQYETGNQNQKILYTATAVSFDPVPDFRFQIPKSGYKILK